MFSELFAKYQFGAIHTADIHSTKTVKSQIGWTLSEIFRRLLHPGFLSTCEVLR